MLSRLWRVLALLSIPATLVGIFVYAQEHPSITYPPNLLKVAAAWEYDKTCSQIAPESGGDLSDVQWIIYPADTRHDEAGNRIFGEWLPPDTIMLDSVYADSSWLLAHELLHHLIHARQDIERGEPHPWVPFAFPCQLMEWQHYGGIMQYTPFKKKQ